MTRFSEFAERFHHHFSIDPNRRVTLGIPGDLGSLPDPSLAHAASVASEAERLLSELGGIDPGTLDFEQRLDSKLARLMLEAEVHALTHRFNDRLRLEQLPNAGDEIGDGIFQLFINDPRPAAERLLDITTRLEAVPRFLDAMLERLSLPLARWKQMDLKKVAGLPQLFDSVVAWSDAVTFADRQRLLRARAAAEQALEAYGARLAAMPAGAGLHLSEADARRTVELRGIDLDFSTLHAIAKKFLAETSETIEALRVQLAEKYRLGPDTSVERLEAFLQERFAVPLPSGRLEDILERYERERERVLAFVEARQLFPIPPDQDLSILRTPSFMEPSIPAGAMLPPPPFRAGTKRSLVYLTLSHELLPEHTELSIPAMMIHEGIPGHHLQLATAASHPSVIRRHVEAMDQAEGWTTMLEDYMLDVGYLEELQTEARFVGKRDISRLAARVAIDLFFMTGARDYLDIGAGCDLSDPDPFRAAASLLSKVTGFVPGRVDAELNWYSQERGYPLCYLTGNQLVHQLKSKVFRANTPHERGVDLERTFHRVFLEAGNMPLSLLEEVFTHQGLL